MSSLPAKTLSHHTPPTNDPFEGPGLILCTLICLLFPNLPELCLSLYLYAIFCIRNWMTSGRNLRRLALKLIPQRQKKYVLIQ